MCCGNRGNLYSPTRAAIAELRARIVTLEGMAIDARVFCEARQVAGTPAGAAVGRDRDPPDLRPPNVLADDAGMAVVEALRAGLSIRAAADRCNVNRNKVFRVRRRAITEGCLVVSPN